MRRPQDMVYQCLNLTTLYSRDPDTAMAALMGTDKLHAEESEAYFRVLIEAAPDAMIIVDGGGEIVIVNAQAETMFGYDRAEMLGNTIEMLLPERIRKAHVSHRDGFINDPELRPMGINMELVGQRSDGSEFPVEISLSPVKTEKAQFVSSVIRDVTRRKRMEEEIIEARREAERANKANSAFLAAASHDLRQPVQALSLLNGALRRTVKDDRALEMVESMEHSLTAMTNLLNSLLDISRLDAGKVIPEIEDFPLQRIIDRLSQDFSRKAQHKGLVYTRSNCAAVVRSDPNLLSEIIQNLVGNAIRYTERGQVVLRCVEDDGKCWLEVEDTGIGIDEAQLEEIFHEFHQVRSSRSSKEGFGLGLAIVKRLGDLLDHEINVESTLGKGSVFRVGMPITSGAVDPADNPGGDDDRDAQSGSGLVILIEDDTNIANAWGHLLEAEGYRVATAASADEARTLINHIDEQPALIISDFHLLDGSTGVEAVVDIREHFDSNIPAFIVTGDTSKVVKEAHTVENSTLLNKPVNTVRLLAAARIATETGEVPED